MTVDAVSALRAPAGAHIVVDLNYFPSFADIGGASRALRDTIWVAAWVV